MKLFGTDGIRGVANEKLTPELAFSLGQAAGRWILEAKQKPCVYVGRDTRRSGAMLNAALQAGFCSVGVDVVDLGVVPTPTVSFAARTSDCGLGAIISASHNPAPDNGIKFVGHDGRKLADDVEARIEELLASSPVSLGDTGLPPQTVEGRPVGEAVGEIRYDRSAVESYLSYLSKIVPERLDGYKIAVDAAHGAAFELAPEILIRLGAEVVLTGADPDGMNINAEGGATKPETVGKLTLESGAHVGVAFDGDADRAVFCDEQGRLINGDRTIGIWCAHYGKSGLLNPKAAVGTVMSNGGFEQYLTQNGIELHRTPVGDKYVARKLEETRARVGGEQSGHIIFPERGPTGDGLITMLEFLRVLRREGRAASSFMNDYEPWPQLLINVTVDKMNGWNEGALVGSALNEGEKTLGDHGRLVVRASGTQPMIRVMVEASSYDLRDEVAGSILDAMTQEVGGKVYSRVDLTHALGD